MVILLGLVWLLGVVVWGFPILSVALSAFTLTGGGAVGVFTMLAAVLAFEWLSRLTTEGNMIFSLYTLIALAACAYTFQWWALAWLFGFALIHFGKAKLWW